LSVGNHTFYATTTDSIGNTTRDPIEGTKSFVVSGAPAGTICTSFTYSNWNSCQSNNTQTRTVSSSLPNGCTGGSPTLTQSCNYVAPILPQNQICTSFTYSNWNSCQSNNTQTRTVSSSLPNGCTGGSPTVSKSCDYISLYTGNDSKSILTPEQEISSAYTFAYKI
jgi:hypothetical protein